MLVYSHALISSVAGLVTQPYLPAVHISTMEVPNHYQRQLQWSIKMDLATEIIIGDFKELEEI